MNFSGKVRKWAKSLQIGIFFDFSGAEKHRKTPLDQKILYDRGGLLAFTYIFSYIQKAGFPLLGALFLSRSEVDARHIRLD